MEPDLVLEVPDTPERLAWLAEESSGHPSQKKNFSVEVDPLSPHQDIGHFSLMNSHHPNLKCDTRIIPNSAICQDTKRKVGKALEGENGEFLRNRRSCALLGMGSSLPDILVGHPQSQTGITTCEKEKTILQDDACADIKSRGKGKGVDFGDSYSKSHQELLRVMQTDVSQRPRGKRRLVHNGHLSPCNISRISIASEVHSQNGMTSDGNKWSSFDGISDRDKLKGMRISENWQPRNSQRKRVKNGHISQNNSSDSCTVTQPMKDELEVLEFRGVPNPIGSSQQTRNLSPDSKGRYNGSEKGKATADASMMTNGRHCKVNLRSSRPYGAAGEDVAIYGDSKSYTVGFEDLGWRTHDQTEKEPTVSSSESVSIYSRGDAFGHSSDQRNKDATGTRNHLNVFLDNSETFALPGSNLCAERPSSQSDPESRRKTCTDGKRKYNTTGNSNGESSSSVSEVPEVLYLGTSWQPSISRSTRTHHHWQHGNVLGSIIEVDELHSPEATSSNLQEQNHSASDSSNARARQVESDELLARQIQEQLYNESPGPGNREEIDAAIAWSLQQEENTPRASLASGQTQHSHRDRLIARLHSQLPSRNYMSRSVNVGRYGSSRRTAQLMRDADIPELDLNMRFNLHEGLEAGINSGTHMVFSNIPHIQHDFNENDYEMLLALDDNNHQHTGASGNQISNLPESIVQTDNVEEPCAVCLEKPSIGEIIRHLPCLHKFHKYCIDQWLKRKTTCPICKSGIT